MATKQFATTWSTPLRGYITWRRRARRENLDINDPISMVTPFVAHKSIAILPNILLKSFLALTFRLRLCNIRRLISRTQLRTAVTLKSIVMR